MARNFQGRPSGDGEADDLMYPKDLQERIETRKDRQCSGEGQGEGQGQAERLVEV